ncbi:hypothetical protein H6F43_04295 [Leptolyngbya sp. FACHB-36]|nr:hypothetical protein [Leptolyngbya sp. FACHB-36]
MRCSTPGPDEVRILTLWEPWASLISLGLKKFETRSWGTKYRCRLAVHAAQRKPSAPDISIWVQALKLGNHPLYCQQPAIDLLRCQSYGAIAALSQIVNCLEMWDSTVYGPPMPPRRRGIDISTVPALEKLVGDWREGRFAWQLENTVHLPKPIPYKGGQGLRRLQNEAVLSAISAQVEEAIGC